MKKSPLFPQRGFTIVEIMVAMVIGLILLAVVASIFTGSKQSYRVQDNLSRIQENGRFATETLARFIRDAGFRSAPDLNTATTTLFPTGKEAIIGTEGPDTITVSYTGSGTPVDGTITDCLGTSVATAAVATNTFKVVGKTLSCTSGVNTQSLIDGVEDFQILYGWDKDADKAANTYVKASDLATADWNNVVSVRVCILLSSEQNNLTTKKQTYTDCNGTSQTATDYKFYRAFKSTITLRNRAA